MITLQVDAVLYGACIIVMLGVFGIILYDEVLEFFSK